MSLNPRSLKLFVALTLLLTITFSSYTATAAPARAVMNIQFKNGTTAPRTLQDVFVERNDIAADQVMRLDLPEVKDPSNIKKTMYTAAKPTQPDPTKRGPNPLGPFPKGASLGFTVEQWVAATGTGTYTLDGDNGELQLSFQNLRPNGLYTAWCGIRGADACTADAAANEFRADAQGNGSMRIKVKRLPDTGPGGPSVVAMAYHSDNESCGASPCDFGLNSHVQLEWVLPAPAAQTGPAAQTTPVPQTLPVGGASFEGISNVWLLLSIGAALIAGGWLFRRSTKRHG